MFTGMASGHLWPDATPYSLLSSTSLFLLQKPKLAPFPRGEFQRLWDCKVTPAYGACQGGNTTGCISNNDGVGAGIRDNFSTREIHGPFTKLHKGAEDEILKAKVRVIDLLSVRFPQRERAPGAGLRRRRSGCGDFRMRQGTNAGLKKSCSFDAFEAFDKRGAGCASVQV